VEAFYIALEEAPRNVQVLATLDGGMTDVTILDERSPPDVLADFIGNGNWLHGVGGKSSFMESYILCPAIEEKWGEKRKKEAEERRDAKRARTAGDQKGEDVEPEANDEATSTLAAGKRTQAGYQTSYFEFISLHFPRSFKRFDSYLSASSFWKKMSDLDLTKEYTDYIREHFKSSEQSLEHSVVFHANKTIFNLLEQHCGYLDRAHFRDFLLATLRFVIPTKDGTPWIIRTLGDTDLIKNLFVKLPPDSKAVKSVHALREKSSTSPAMKVTKAKAKAAKAKAKPKVCKASVGDAPITSDVCLAEDIIATVNFYISHVKDAPQPCIDKLLCLCIEFAMCGKVLVAEKNDLKKLKDVDRNLIYLSDPAAACTKAYGTACLQLHCFQVHRTRDGRGPFGNRSVGGVESSFSVASRQTISSLSDIP
jgi:hypothetical protein